MIRNMRGTTWATPLAEPGSRPGQPQSSLVSSGGLRSREPTQRVLTTKTDPNGIRRGPIPAKASVAQPQVSDCPRQPGRILQSEAQPSAPQFLIKMSGNGHGNSAPFLVNTGKVTATYTYNCSAFGQAGNFTADMVNGNIF